MKVIAFIPAADGQSVPAQIRLDVTKCAFAADVIFCGPIEMGEPEGEGT
ncbi:MAG: hypothetical protein IPF97_06370 [Sphingomonadales bacterium]|nr:hypothetical protein [Sphingomonadales bacterium]